MSLFVCETAEDTLEMHVAFSEQAKDLVETIDKLDRAIAIIETEVKGGAAPMMQNGNADGVIQALSSLVSAEAIPSTDGQKLATLVQQYAQSDDHGEGILGVLNDLVEKANTLLKKYEFSSPL